MMLNTLIAQHLKKDPEMAAISSTIEKEILHHDILRVMAKNGLTENITFIGGTCLRLCYRSMRLSEDLDFAGGFDFSPRHFEGVEHEIKSYLEEKYHTEVWIKRPKEVLQTNTASWQVSIEREAGRPDLPRQKIHIDICVLPAFQAKMRSVINHYPHLPIETTGLYLMAQSQEEIFVDKWIALAFRNRIKSRDLWDLHWMYTNAIELDTHLLQRKLEARSLNSKNFQEVLKARLNALREDPGVMHDFQQELSRFLPPSLQQKTIATPYFWDILCDEIDEVGKRILTRPL